ncbi:hypothetical protein BD310DRAFT_942035 [Dichomitus squalens]|uniref:Uncharacterized protein n=1 Tax=Dichomitus squalens TaxID=114155 RepID=A0A4V2K6A5_9APHY|nr:hypothetical protein BD310DRAFT_942035 [Dichomitus squalens]
MLSAGQPFIYATNAGYVRGRLRTTLNKALQQVTGDRRAKMRYTPEAFRKHVFLCYNVKLAGWPENIPFRNLSSRDAPSIPDLWRLIHLAESGVLYFTAVTREEVDAAQLSVANAVPGPLFPAPLPKVPRRDVGSRKPRFDGGGNFVAPRHERNGPKSAAWIGEEVADSETVGPAGLRPITMWKDGICCIQDDGSGVWREVTGDLSGMEDPEDPIRDWDCAV